MLSPGMAQSDGGKGSFRDVSEREVKRHDDGVSGPLVKDLKERVASKEATAGLPLRVHGQSCLDGAQIPHGVSAAVLLRPLNASPGKGVADNAARLALPLRRIPRVASPLLDAARTSRKRDSA